MNWTIHMKSLPRKFITDSAAKVFTGGYLHRHHLLPRTYQNSRLSEGKQVFSINHIVQTGQAEWATVINWGREGIFSRSKFSDAAAPAAAKSLQLCPTLCDPMDGSLPGSRPRDSPGKNTGVGCHFLLQCMNVKSESDVTQLCPTLRDPMDCSPPGSSVHGIFQARVLEWSAVAFSISDASQGLTWQTGLSNDSRVKSSILTIFCTGWIYILFIHSPMIDV